MKFNLIVNQKQAIDLGITHINQAHVFDLVSHSTSWATPVLVDGEVYFWTARQKVCSELPLIDMKPDTVYRHFKSLEALGLIEYIKQGKKDLTRLTDLGKTYHSFTMSDSNPDTISESNPSDYVGLKSENEENSDSNPNKLGFKSEKHSDSNPTYTTTNNIIPTKQSTGRAGARFDEFYDLYPESKSKSKLKDKAMELWVEGGCDDIADLIIDDVKFRSMNHSKWLNGFAHNLDNYLKDKHWTDPVLLDGVLVTKPPSSHFPVLNSVLGQIECRLTNKDYEITCNDAKAIWVKVCGDFKARRIEQTMESFLDAATVEYQVMADNR